MTIDVTAEELALIVEALDSHKYWQLSEEDERDSGFVYLHQDEDADEVDESCPSDCDDERHAAIRACDALAGRLGEVTNGKAGD